MSQENNMSQSEAPIGVFDSGVGGLTVVREIMRQIPNEKIIYFGDTARVPYGSKSKDTVTRFSRQIVRFLQAHRVKTIVVACNTASAYALDELDKEVDIPVLGVLKPGAKTAAEVTKNGKIGVTDANCPDHYCMDRGMCSSGTQIVCLPNRLIIRFKGQQPVDSVVG